MKLDEKYFGMFINNKREIGIRTACCISKPREFIEDAMLELEKPGLYDNCGNTTNDFIEASLITDMLPRRSKSVKMLDIAIVSKLECVFLYRSF